MQSSGGLFLHSILLSGILLYNFQPSQPPRTLTSVSAQEYCALLGIPLPFSVAWIVPPGRKWGQLQDSVYLFFFSSGSQSWAACFHMLKAVVSWILSSFLIVYSGRVNLATVSLSWSKIKVSVHIYMCISVYIDGPQFTILRLYDGAKDTVRNHTSNFDLFLV